MPDAQQYDEALDEFLDAAEAPPGYYGPDDLLTFDGTGDAIGNVPEGLRKPWTIPDDGAADWCLRKLAKVRAGLEEVKQLMIARERALREWNEAVTRPLRSDEKHWVDLLEGYAVRRRTLSGDASVRLPNGTLGTTLRDKGGSVEIHDPGVLLAWLHEHPALEKRWCKMDPEPLVTRFKDEVHILVGGTCDHCSMLIVPYREPAGNTTVWISQAGADCKVGMVSYEHGHAPRLDEGEVVARQVAALIMSAAPPTAVPVVVPGLAVRSEHVISRVTV